MILSVHVDDETLARLQWYASRDAQCRTIEDLAEAAIAEAALRADNRPIDPFADVRLGKSMMEMRPDDWVQR